MRKLMILLLVFCLLISGCGKNEKPEDISSEAYEKAICAIETVDAYLGKSIDLEETIDDLYDIEIDSDALFDVEYMLSLKRNDEGDLFDENMEYPRDVMVDAKILDIQTQVSSLQFVDSENVQITLETIMEFRNDLAKKINYKE